MIKVGKVAIDGTKIEANAALDANRNRKWLEEQVNKMFTEAEATDKAEDAFYGNDQRGDELPKELRTRDRRLAKLQAAKEELENEQRTKDLAFAERLAERKKQRRRKREEASWPQTTSASG